MTSRTSQGHSRIAGIGAYLPDRVVSNAYLAEFFGTTEAWILERTGIRERRYAAQGQGVSDMGAEAARAAVADAGWTLDQVEFIIFATLSPDHHFPGAGCYMQRCLGLPGVGVLDVRNQCTGFLYSLTVASALIGSGQYSKVLVVCAEAQSHCIEVPDAPPEVAILFGDAAAAVALEPSTEPGQLTSALHADGEGADLLKLELFDFARAPFITADDLDAGRHFVVMNGARIFLRAVKKMLESCHEVLDEAQLTLDAVHLVIPHQANLRINETVRKRLKLSPEKMFSNIEERGNTTAASIPLALYEARQAGRLDRGDLLLMPAFGSGLTWGAVLWRF